MIDFNRCLLHFDSIFSQFIKLAASWYQCLHVFSGSVDCILFKHEFRFWAWMAWAVNGYGGNGHFHAD